MRGKFIGAPPEVSPRWLHQGDALDFVNVRHDEGAEGTLLAMDMGTGKTRVAVERIAKVCAPPHGYLFIQIVCPKSVVSVWEAEIATWWPEGQERPIVIAHPGGNPKRSADGLRQLHEIASAGSAYLPPVILVVNYEAIYGRSSRFAEIAARIPWRLMVADEAQRLKSPNGKTSRQMAAMAKKHGAERLSLTGTPTPQSHLDAYGLMRFTDPKVFGTTFAAFKARYTRSAISSADFKNPLKTLTRTRGGEFLHHVPNNMDDFERRLRGAAFRVDARDVHDLPEVTDQNVYPVLVDREASAYRQMERRLIAEIDDHLITAANGAVKLMRLQQIASGFSTDEETRNLVRLGTSKQNALCDIIEGLPNDEPLVVFCRFKADLAAVQSVADKLDIGSAELSGSVNDLAWWQRGAVPIIAVQIQSGGVGITLVRARYAVWYTLPWSLAQYEQARARLVRPGQEHHVTFINLIAKLGTQLHDADHLTIDQIMLEALAARGEMVASIMAALKRVRR